MTKDQVKYVWLDEDGEHVSPMHVKFGSALNFINSWHGRVERLRERFGDDFDLTAKDSAYGYVSLSKSGKPPVKLVRAVVKTFIEDLTDAEATVVSVYVETTTDDRQ